MDDDAGGASGRAAGRTIYRTTVRPEWIDYNDHINVAYYNLVFDQAADVVLDTLGLGEAYRQASGCSIFVRECHLVFDREIAVGTKLTVHSRILDTDDRRLVLFQEMRAAGGDATVATCEALCVHVDLVTRRSRPWPAAAGVALSLARQGKATTSPPARAGRAIALARQASVDRPGTY